MPYIILSDAPIFDGRDAIVGTRTTRFSPTVYETAALAIHIASREFRAEGFADDTATYAVDALTLQRVYKRQSSTVFIPESEIPF